MRDITVFIDETVNILVVGFVARRIICFYRKIVLENDLK